LGLVSIHYLHRLPIRSAPSETKPRSRKRRPIRPGSVIATLAIVAISSLAAVGLERIGTTLHGHAPPTWPASGCLSASVEPLGAQAVAGQGSLCIADGQLHGTLDVEHLEPMARYVEWIAYFDSPSLCSAGALQYQVQHFSRPCTLVDLGGPQPRGLLRDVAATSTDSQGVLHLDNPVAEIELASRAQAWLLLGRASPSSAPHTTLRLFDDDASKPVGRAVVDVP
jgi:hypothetical protein